MPAGRYARQVLEKAGVWDKVKDRVIEAADVRAALALVVKDEADAGVVYVTDAKEAGDKVRTALIVPDDLHKPIRYPLALLHTDSIKPESAEILRVPRRRQGGRRLPQGGLYGPAVKGRSCPRCSWDWPRKTGTPSAPAPSRPLSPSW